MGQSEALDLDLALCLLKTGDVEGARRHYSDKSILRYDYRLTVADLPGAHGVTALEASIRLARALDLYVSSRNALAVAEFERVEALAPRNAVAPYHRGMALTYLGRPDLAREPLARAARLGRGELRADAARRSGQNPARPGNPGL